MEKFIKKIKQAQKEIKELRKTDFKLSDINQILIKNNLSEYYLDEVIFGKVE